MDLATLGALLVGLGAVLGGLFTYFGKRGENAITGYSSLTDNLQEELARKSAQAATAEAEVARLRSIVTRLGGDPS